MASSTPIPTASSTVTSSPRTFSSTRHPYYADSLHNLAELYAAMGRHAEAEPLYLRAREIRRVALGEQHPHYADSLHNLVELYAAMGRHAEAERLVREGLGS
jgi:tetratricopeptide (TPR) repeat protein